MASTTVALVGVTAAYVVLTWRLVRIQGSPLAARHASDDAAAVELERLLLQHIELLASLRKGFPLDATRPYEDQEGIADRAEEVMHLAERILDLAVPLLPERKKAALGTSSALRQVVIAENQFIIASLSAAEDSIQGALETIEDPAALADPRRRAELLEPRPTTWNDLERHYDGSVSWKDLLAGTPHREAAEKAQRLMDLLLEMRLAPEAQR